MFKSLDNNFQWRDYSVVECSNIMTVSLRPFLGVGVQKVFSLFWNKIQWNPSCEATPFASEKWPFKGLPLVRGRNQYFMFRFTLSSSVSRGAGLLSGWLLKRGSTVASSNGIYTLNGIHMWVFFNTESLNVRATHF